MTAGDTYNPKGIFSGVFIPEAMVRLPNTTLSMGAKILFGRLCWHVNDKGECFPSRPTLATEIGASEFSVRDYLKELEDSDFIRRVRNGPHANDYEFIWNDILVVSVRKDRHSAVDQKKKIDTPLSEDRQPAVRAYKELREVLTEEIHITYIDQVSFLRIWSTVRGLKKPSRGDRARIAENWSDIKASEDAIHSALSIFAAWLKTAADVHSPIQLFLRDPDKWIPDEPAPTSHPAPPQTGVLPGTGGAAPSVTQEAVVDVAAPTDTPAPPAAAPVAPAPHWRDSWLSMWNGLVTAMPVSEWDSADDRKLSMVSQDPEFVKRFFEICEQAQLIHANKGDCGYLTLQWVMAAQKDDPAQRNWKKLFKSMAFMAKSQQISGSGHRQHIDMKEVTRKAIEKNFPKKKDDE